MESVESGVAPQHILTPQFTRVQSVKIKTTVPLLIHHSFQRQDEKNFSVPDT